MPNTNCRPKVVQVHKVSGTKEMTEIDKINQRLQMTSAKATNDACNDAQVNEEPPSRPPPPTNPDDHYNKFMGSTYSTAPPSESETPTVTPTTTLSETPAVTPISEKDKQEQQQQDLEEDFTNMIYYNHQLNQTIQFLIVVLFGSGAYALWRATK
jgi:hypothetical protein